MSVFDEQVTQYRNAQELFFEAIKKLSSPYWIGQLKIFIELNQQAIREKIQFRRSIFLSERSSFERIQDIEV